MNWYLHIPSKYISYRFVTGINSFNYCDEPTYADPDAESTYAEAQDPHLQVNEEEAYATLDDTAASTAGRVTTDDNEYDSLSYNQEKRPSLNTYARAG